MSEPHKVSEPSVLDLYRENQQYAEEVRRLREALEEIARSPTAMGKDIARAALAAAEKGGDHV